MTCDPCLGLGYARPRHYKCQGNGCSCCGEKAQPIKLKTPKPRPRQESTTRIYEPVSAAVMAEGIRLRSDEGLTWRQVGERMGRDGFSIRYACARAGMDTAARGVRAGRVQNYRHLNNPRSPDANTIQQAAARKEAGASWRAIGAELGVDHSYIRKLVIAASTAT